MNIRLFSKTKKWVGHTTYLKGGGAPAFDAPAFDAPACGRGAAVLGAVLALPPTLFALGDLAKAGHF